MWYVPVYMNHASYIVEQLLLPITLPAVLRDLSGHDMLFPVYRIPPHTPYLDFPHCLDCQTGLAPPHTPPRPRGGPGSGHSQPGPHRWRPYVGRPLLYMGIAHQPLLMLNLHSIIYLMIFGDSVTGDSSELMRGTYSNALMTCYYSAFWLL